MDGEMQLCTGCEIEHPISHFRFRNKNTGVRYKQCNTYQKKIQDTNVFTYPDTQICPQCKIDLPIDKFHFRSKKTGKRAARCGICVRSCRDKEADKATMKEWHENKGGREWKKEYNHKYKKRRSELHKKRCKTDISYKLKCNIRTRIYGSLRASGLRRNEKIKYLGMNKYYYQKWLEYQFDENMNWDNYGSYWEIDHVLAIDSFKFTDENDDEIYTCFDWKNTRPLEAGENARKSNTIDEEIIENHKYTVMIFIEDMFDEFGENCDNDRYSYYTAEPC